MFRNYYSIQGSVDSLFREKDVTKLVETFITSTTRPANINCFFFVFPSSIPFLLKESDIHGSNQY